jgi:predicted nuclease of predicted toxin-antitoxin system
MKLVADESIDDQIVTRLRADGHVVWAVKEQIPQASDPVVLAEATQRQQLLLTIDSDFERLIMVERLPAPYGLMRIRLDQAVDVLIRASVIAQVIVTQGPQLVGKLSVIRKNGTVSIRDLP